MTHTKQTTDLVAATPMREEAGGSVSIVPQHMGHVVEFAKLMSKARGAIRQEYIDNPGACLAVTTAALRFGMDPFALAQKAYFVNGQIAYEAQVIMALLNTRAPIKGRLRYEYNGSGADRRCTCKATLEDGDEVSYTTPPLRMIAGKSPLWKRDPDQQLAYYAARSLARRHFPEVIMGVYARDELQDGDAVELDSNATATVVDDAAPGQANPLLAEAADDDGDDDDTIDVDVEIDGDDAEELAPQEEGAPSEEAEDYDNTFIETLIKCLPDITDIGSLRTIWKTHEERLKAIKAEKPVLYERALQAFEARKKKLMEDVNGDNHKH